MAARDWALVVGVTKYPDPAFDPLKGPEADATDFYAWVTSKDGGGVPLKQAKLIVSSQFKKSASPIDAQPAAEAVTKFFEALDVRAQENDKNGKGLVAGRRLYIYFSGHGFAPSDTETALLMANAAKNRLKHHIPGREWANLFYRSGYFEEVMLFMDCCRNILPQTIPNPPSVSVRNNPQAIKKGRRFYAFATEWGAESRERVIGKGKSRGVFSMALMEGLRGRACEAGTNRVTAKSLRSYLFNNMKDYLGEADLRNPDIPKEPEIEPSQKALDFTIVDVKNPPKGSVVRVLLSPKLAGLTINIRSGQDVVATGKATPPAWKRELPRGLYLAEVVGGPKAAKPFEVRGAAQEVVNVDFR
jgi:hypothetical protein